MTRIARRHILLLLAALASLAALTPLRAEDAVLVPPPPAEESQARDAQASGGLRSVVLAGGCFWGVQGVFQRVKGVTQAVSGYAGGARGTAHYETVSGGRTGHAESVKVTYDPAVIGLGDLLRIYFSVAHDPTQLNRQGPDQGSQYRSEIFFADAAQEKFARDYIARIDAAHVFAEPVATRLEALKEFYPAEGYHQDYLTLHPEQPYIVAYDAPKLIALRRLFPDRYREAPALVSP